MTTKKAAKTEITLTLPTLDDLGDQAGKLRKDFEKALEDAGKRAADLLPASGRKRLDEWTKAADKRVAGLRKDVDKRVAALRKDVDKRVDTLRKDAEKRTKSVTDTIEKEARKQLNTMFKRMRLPVRSDIDGLKRRMTSIERKLDQLGKQQSTKQAKQAA